MLLKEKEKNKHMDDASYHLQNDQIAQTHSSLQACQFQHSSNITTGDVQSSSLTCTTGHQEKIQKPHHNPCPRDN